MATISASKKKALFSALPDALTGADRSQANAWHVVNSVHEGAIETMSVDTVQPSLAVQAEHRKPDANGNSGRDPRRNGKPAQSEKEPQDQPDVFLNDLGQLTGKTINITA